LEGFSRNISLLVSLVKGTGAKVVLFGFKQAREPLLTRNRPELVGKERALTIGLSRTLGEMKRIADQQRIPYWDPAELAIADELFVDNCHLNTAGEQLKAAFVYKKLFETKIVH